MLLDPEQETRMGRAFESYLRAHHHDDILQLIEENDGETHRPLIVNAMTLFEANMEVGDYFNAYPNDVLTVFDKVLHRTAIDLSKNAHTTQCSGQLTKEERMRRTLHARITGLPLCPELTRDTIPRSRDVGHFLSVTATVIRTSVAKVLEYERHHMCNKCRYVFALEADFEQFYTFVPPLTCPNPDGCNSQRFCCLSGVSEPGACRDYQEIKIQEQVQRLSVGSIPRSLVVILEDDLVDSCKSGDDVTVFGVICQRWKPFSDGAFCDVELVLKANNIEVNNQQMAPSLLIKDFEQEFGDFWQSYKHDPIAGRDHILLSMCPEVFGMYVTKLAVAMVLAGGVQRIDHSGTKIRGECHMLLVGDPGTGKSQFLKYAAKIIPRSVLTAGIGSTSAGLTVSAVRDGGDWHLEAGALVLSDGGLCCIDEFNSIKEHDRISIHEAMEQQSISVAKAGIVCKLNTRSTILAATNPKGKCNPNESVTVALASPLLSRFDLVLVLLDTMNANWDHVISSFILEERGLPSEACSLWPLEKMKAYFSIIKQLKPVVSEDANTILTRYYQLQRQSHCRNAARTTVRMLESLSRLAEAHAKIMYREMVTIEDAIIAVSVMECSMQGGALLGRVNALLTTFPTNPGKQYEEQSRLLLEGLNLPQLLQKEMQRLATQKANTSDLPEMDSSGPEIQTHLRNFDDRSPLHGITTDPKGDSTEEMGLNWFLSMNPSESSRTTNSPNNTSPHNLKAKPASNQQAGCKTKKNIEIHNTFGSEEEVNQIEQRKDLSGRASVCQKVARNLREKRLQQLKDQDNDGDNVLSTRKKKTCVLNSALDSHSGSTAALGNIFTSNNQVQSSGLQVQGEKDHRNQIGNKNLSATSEETVKVLHPELLQFSFKQRKANPALELATEDETEDIHVPTQSRERNQKSGQHNGFPNPAAADKQASKGREKGKNIPESGKKLLGVGKESRTSENTSSGQEKSPPVLAKCRAKKRGEAENMRQERRFDGSPFSREPSISISSLAERFSFTSSKKSTNTTQPQEGRNLLAQAKKHVEHSKTNVANASQNLPDYHGPNAFLDQTVPVEQRQHTKKRTFSHSDPPTTGCSSKRSFFDRSLLDSEDLSNDVLDTDWDLEN